MALGKHRQPQNKLFVSMDVIARSDGNVFYDQLQRALRKRGELVERSFQHVLDRGGQRRTYARGIEHVQKNYLLAVARLTLSCCCAKCWA